MNGKQKDKGGVAAFLLAGCLVVVMGLVVAYAGILAINWAIAPWRSRAAKQYLEQQAAKARAVQEEMDASVTSQKTDAASPVAKGELPKSENWPEGSAIPSVPTGVPLQPMGTPNEPLPRVPPPNVKVEPGAVSVGSIHTGH